MGTGAKRRKEARLTIIKLSEHSGAEESVSSPQEATFCYLIRLSEPDSMASRNPLETACIISHPPAAPA